MKFPRNARIFRGQLDAAPFLSVFFLLVMFLLIGSLLYTPGVQVELPRELSAKQNLPGVAGPTVAVAMDKNGRYYFQDQLVSPETLKARLETAAKATHPPPTIVISADREVPYEKVIHLALLARSAGISNALFATLPRVFPP